GRRAVPALAIALGGAAQPLGRLITLSVHQEAEPGGPGGVPQLRELPLVELARLGRAIALDRRLRTLAPRHARSMVARRWPPRRPSASSAGDPLRSSRSTTASRRRPRSGARRSSRR